MWLHTTWLHTTCLGYTPALSQCMLGWSLVTLNSNTQLTGFCFSNLTFVCAVYLAACYCIAEFASNKMDAENAVRMMETNCEMEVQILKRTDWYIRMWQYFLCHEVTSHHWSLFQIIYSHFISFNINWGRMTSITTHMHYWEQWWGLKVLTKWCGVVPAIVSNQLLSSETTLRWKRTEI